VTTAFVLSGGGSLGAVQVGMLQALADRRVRPDLLVGTSAGAVNALWVAHHCMTTDSLSMLGSVWEQLCRRDIFPVSPGHVVRALLGRSQALCSSQRLADLVRAYAGFEELGEARIPVHLIATDLLSGEDVCLSSGDPVDAVRASAAIPGIFPPVWLGGRWLIDGAMAPHSGVTAAARLGATQVYVLPAGVPCALPHPPRSAVGVALHALSLLIEQRLIAEVADPPPGVRVHLLPPLCPATVSAADFGHAAELIRRGRRSSATWIDGGGLDRRDQARFLALHDHRPTPPDRSARREGPRASALARSRLRSSAVSSATNDQEPRHLRGRLTELLEAEAGTQRGVEVRRQHPVVGADPPPDPIAVGGPPTL
jgi:NTE family protein